MIGHTTGRCVLAVTLTNKHNFFQNLTFNGTNVETWSSQKHLGLNTDDKLSFDVISKNKLVNRSKSLKLLNCFQSLIQGMIY